MRNGHEGVQSLAGQVTKLDLLRLGGCSPLCIAESAA